MDANLTLNQLTNSNNGAGRLQAMIGANNFFKSESDVGFRFMKGAANKANHIRITLNAMDTYDVEFYKVWGATVKTISTHKGIYNDMLKELFETETKLYLSL